jgi:hypothetical protein
MKTTSTWFDNMSDAMVFAFTVWQQREMDNAK